MKKVVDSYTWVSRDSEKLYSLLNYLCRIHRLAEDSDDEEKEKNELLMLLLVSYVTTS